MRPYILGFSLVELIIAVTVFAVLLGIGVPSFIPIIEGSRLSAQTNELLHALQTTRSEAIRHNNTRRFCIYEMEWRISTPNSPVPIRQGTLQPNINVNPNPVCIDFRADGLPYSCACANPNSSTDLMTNETIEIRTPNRTRNIRIRTASIYTE